MVELFFIGHWIYNWIHKVYNWMVYPIEWISKMPNLMLDFPSDENRHSNFISSIWMCEWEKDDPTNRYHYFSTLSSDPFVHMDIIMILFEVEWFKTANHLHKWLHKIELMKMVFSIDKFCTAWAFVHAMFLAVIF